MVSVTVVILEASILEVVISPKHWFDRGLGSACLLVAMDRCIGSPPS